MDSGSISLLPPIRVAAGNIFTLVSAGPKGSVLEPRLASSSSPSPCLPACSGFKHVPSALPSCIRFLLELENVTLEGGCSTAGFLLAATICCCWLQVWSPAPAQLLSSEQAREDPVLPFTQTELPRRESAHAAAPLLPHHGVCLFHARTPQMCLVPRERCSCRSHSGSGTEHFTPLPHLCFLHCCTGWERIKEFCFLLFACLPHFLQPIPPIHFGFPQISLKAA